MTRVVVALIALPALSFVPGTEAVEPPTDMLTVRDGQWTWRREVLPIVRQGSASGEGLAVCTRLHGARGAWRCYVEPGIGGTEAGIVVLADEAGSGGLRLGLGAEGLTLRRADGKAVWSDEGMPWYPYQAYLLEVVVEPGRVRVQAFESDGRSLSSQSPWLAMTRAATARPGPLALYTRDAIARFFGWELAEAPLSPIVPDAPNKLRLAAGPGAPWAVVGPGRWTWTGTDHQRLRQRATVERSSAIWRETRGALRSWECRVLVRPGAGGAGMLFQCDDKAEQGLLAWLGGEFGNGTLLLYRLPLDALWGGESGNWHYDTEYVLRAETRLNGEVGEARVQLLQADGQTVIQDSGWVNVGREAATREGHLGFMTWLGTAEFWGFTGDTGPGAVVTTASAVPDLGQGWTTLGDGAWEWADKDAVRLRQTGTPQRALALHNETRGIAGTWRCRYRPDTGSSGGLVFQASLDGREGFAALLTPEGLRLEGLDGRVMWQDRSVRAEPGREFVLTGEVMTDRVAMRCYAADGQTLLSECPAVYVPDTNNRRQGVIGALCRGGRAEFWDWQYTP